MADDPFDVAVDTAYAGAVAYQREARQVVWQAPSTGQVAATIRAQYDRAEAAEAKLAEIRQMLGTYFTVHGNSNAASLTHARDLAEGVRQILDRVTL